MTAALDFLRRWSPAGPWHLVAFGARTYSAWCATAEAADAFVEWHADRGTYFVVGEAKAPPARHTPRKDEIAGSQWLWVDIDPRDGAPVEEERERIRHLLTDALPKEVPAPTLIVDSGRGHWAFWQLAELCDDLDLIEAKNQALANALGADKCWNANRVARLPGTLNTRTGQRAAVVADHPERTYQIEAFPSPGAGSASLPDDGDGAHLSAGAPVAVEPRRLADLDELDTWAVPARVQVVILEGRDPFRPNRWPSRSEAVHYVACELTRCQVPAAVILGVLLDRRFGISASTYTLRDGGARQQPVRYAQRQVEQAAATVAQQRPRRAARSRRRTW